MSQIYGPSETFYSILFIQLSLQEWLSSELRVQRSEDALTDPERWDWKNAHTIFWKVK